MLVGEIAILWRCQATGMKILSRATTFDHRRSSSRCAVTFSHLPWIHKPHKPISKCKSSVGTSSNLNNLDPLPDSKPTKLHWRQDEQFNFSTIFSGCQIGQVRLTFKSDKAEWQSIFKFFPYRIFFCFYQTLDISLKDLGGRKADTYQEMGYCSGSRSHVKQNWIAFCSW